MLEFAEGACGRFAAGGCAHDWGPGRCIGRGAVESDNTWRACHGFLPQASMSHP